MLHAPPLSEPYGTHHTKAFLIHCAAGVRVIVHTANLIYSDCNNKTQGIWWQDFPPKARTGPGIACIQLAAHVCQWPPCAAKAGFASLWSLHVLSHAQQQLKLLRFIRAEQCCT